MVAVQVRCCCCVDGGGDGGRREEEEVDCGWRSKRDDGVWFACLRGVSVVALGGSLSGATTMRGRDGWATKGECGWRARCLGVAVRSAGAT